MKWFTRSWSRGELDDEESHRRLSDYQRHLKSIAADLDNGAEQLASSVNLHDAQVKVCDLEEGGSLRLRLLAGDLQQGYEWLTLIYEGADLLGANSDELRTWRLTDRGAELLYDEIDLSEDARYEHRILVWPQGEFGVRFRSVRVDREPAAPSDGR